MMSYMHSLYDDRIYWKQALSLRNAGYRLIHLGVGDREFDIVSEHGIRLIQIKRTRFSSILIINSIIKRFSRNNEYTRLSGIAASLNADVYHLHDIQLINILKKIKKFKNRPKVIYDAHEPYPITITDREAENVFQRLFNKLYSKYINYREIKLTGFSDVIITTEENVANRFKKHTKETPVEIIYNYCNWSVNDFRDSEKTDYDFIYAGGIRLRRGAMEMLKAVKALKDEDIRAGLLIVGTVIDRGLEETMKQYINKENLSDRVALKPPVQYTEVMKLYKASRFGIALFNDQKVNQTILPIKILEYIAFGLPVLASDTGHIGRITKKYNTGIAVNPKNIAEVATAMKKLLFDHDLYKTQKRNCLKLYKDDFNWSNMGKKLHAIYSGLLFSK